MNNKELQEIRTWCSHKDIVRLISAYEEQVKEIERIQTDLVKVESGNIRLWKENEQLRNQLKLAEEIINKHAFQHQHHCLFCIECGMEYRTRQHKKGCKVGRFLLHIQGKENNDVSKD